MNEDFLSYLWQFQLLKIPLYTTEGCELIIKKPGYKNKDAGPDFKEALIKVDGSIWAGNIEIHVKSSDWFKHSHQFDPNYKSVILHVVHSHDLTETRTSNLAIPTLELKSLYDPSLYSRYLNLKSHTLWIPCQKLIQKADPITIKDMIHSCSIDRLHRKFNSFKEQMIIAKNDHEQVFFNMLAKNFGFKKNEYAFHILSKSISFKLIKKHLHDSLQLEALFFGQAGFLDDEFKESYPRRLAKEYQFLKHKYGLTPIEKSYWNFLRLRPSNFPTIRIAQLSSLLLKEKQLLRAVLEAETPNQMLTLFGSTPNEFWDTHYHFTKISSRRMKQIGTNGIILLIINTVIPFIFGLGELTSTYSLKSRAVEILESLNSEQNAIIRQWKACGIKVSNALESQGLIELKKEYCDKKRCLECRIGSKLIDSS